MAEENNNNINNNGSTNFDSERMPHNDGRTVRLSDLKPKREKSSNADAAQKENKPKETTKKVVKKVIKKVVKSKNETEVAENAKPIVKKVVKKIVKSNNIDNTTVNLHDLKPASNTQNVKKDEKTSKLNDNNSIKKEENEIDKDIILQKKNQKITELNKATNNSSSNTVIKSAADSAKDFEKNESKKINRHQSKLHRFLKKYRALLIVFFVMSFIYLSWTYVVPFTLNCAITDDKINDFIHSKIGYKVDFKTSNFYTTPSLDIGIKISNLKLIYPQATIDDTKNTFLKARVAVIEVPIVPLLLRTISFNEFSLRSVNANLFKDSKGQYIFIQYIKDNFNPNAPKYVLKVPDIIITSYLMPSYDDQTKTFTRNKGTYLKLSSERVKAVLKETNKAQDIKIQ